MAGPDGGRKATIAALLANLGIAVAKLVAFVFTRSAAMLAEGIHSIADSSNQGLLLLGGARARREPTPTHPFGYGRERYFWAFVVAIVLFTLGSLFSLFEGVEKLRHPHEISSLWWAVGVLGVGIVFESFSMRVAVREANAVRRGSWWTFVRRAKVPELPVVLLEDVGALVGLLVALVGVVLAQVTGNPRFDALGSIAIGALLGVIAIVLAAEMKSLLIGESASPGQQAAIREAILADGDLDELIHFRTLHLGPDELLVAGKVTLRSGLSAREVARVIDRIESQIRERVPGAEAIYLESDVREADEGPPPWSPERVEGEQA